MRIPRVLFPQSHRLLAGLTCAALSSGPAARISRAQFEAAKTLAVQQKWPPEHKLTVEAFLRAGGVLPGGARDHAADDGAPRPPPILDVRAPCEFAKGHIPGAISAPLFSDDERAAVGTLYKEAGHDAAVEHGLEIVERKGCDALLASVPDLQPGDNVLVYCFRGGMRSGSVAWLLSQASLRVGLLDGGYKRYRRWALDAWDADRPVVIVGGPTGSGKTDVLHALRGECGAQVLDLEGEAQHRGSIFGALGRPAQPTNEHYENLLATQWAAFDARRPVFIEDESHNVGKCGVPRPLWQRMRAREATVLRLAVPHEARVAKLVAEYGVYDPRTIADCVRGLYKRLGHARVDELCALLEQTQPPALATVADALLHEYYDAMYDYQAKKRAEEMDGAPQHVVKCDSGDAAANAARLLERASALGL